MSSICLFLYYDRAMIKTRRHFALFTIASIMLAGSIHGVAAQSAHAPDTNEQPMPPALSKPETGRLPALPQTPANKPKPQNPDVITEGTLDKVRLEEQEKLFSQLRKSTSAEKSHAIASRLRRSFVQTGDASLDLMLRWAETALNQSRNAEAQDFIDEVQAQRPDNATVWQLRARLHLRRNELAPALHAIRQAMILEPRNFDVLINYATLLRETGNSKAAQKLYEQALRIYPMMKEAQDEMLKITEAESDISL